MSVDVSAGAPGSDQISVPTPSAQERATEFVDRSIAFVQRAVLDVWHFGRFVLFVLYLVLGVITFWLWVLTAVLGLVRFGIRALMLVLLWLSGGVAPPPGALPRSVSESIRLELGFLWRQRISAYEAVARPVARHLIGAQKATRTFWHWSLFRKLCTIVAAGLFIGLPLIYVIPRPHYIQVTDDNAIHYEENGKHVYYLIHAVDLYNPGKTREYLNEDAPYLGKINSQGLKSQIVPGRYYQFWVVGIRWYWMPRLFPNVIKAVDIDAQGRPLTNPSLQLPAPVQTPPPLPSS